MQSSLFKKYVTKLKMFFKLFCPDYAYFLLFIILYFLTPKKLKRNFKIIKIYNK